MKDPFSIIDEWVEVGTERNPVTDQAKKAGATVAEKTTDQVKPTAKAAEEQVAADKALVNALYGPSETPEQGTEQPNHPQQQQQQNQGLAQSGDASIQKPDTADQLKKTRELLKAHMASYGNQFTVEQELRRLQAQKQKEEQEKQKAEAEEAERKKQEAAAQAQELPQPKGKKSGVPDFVLKREQNKAESNRGTSG